MFVIFGQFYNQTTHKWDWQQVGGSATSAEDAKAFAEGFTSTYGVATKLIGRYGTILYLPPITDESQFQTWPKGDVTRIQTTGPAH